MRNKRDKVFLYTWTEADSHKSSSEIASAVFHRLTNTDFPFDCIKWNSLPTVAGDKNMSMIG